MKFNEKLMELRKKEGLSQEEIGQKLNVTRQTISKWELGQISLEIENEIEEKNDAVIEETTIESNKKKKNIKTIVIILILIIGKSIKNGFVYRTFKNKEYDKKY